MASNYPVVAIRSGHFEVPLIYKSVKEKSIEVDRYDIGYVTVKGAGVAPQTCDRIVLYV